MVTVRRFLKGDNVMLHLIGGLVFISAIYILACFEEEKRHDKQRNIRKAWGIQ